MRRLAAGAGVVNDDSDEISEHPEDASLATMAMAVDESLERFRSESVIALTIVQELPSVVEARRRWRHDEQRREDWVERRLWLRARY